MVYNSRHSTPTRKHNHVKIISNNKVRIFSRIYIPVIREYLQSTQVQMIKTSAATRKKSILKCPPTVIKKYKIETQFNESQEMFDRLLRFTPPYG